MPRFFCTGRDETPQLQSKSLSGLTRTHFDNHYATGAVLLRYSDRKVYNEAFFEWPNDREVLEPYELDFANPVVSRFRESDRWQLPPALTCCTLRSWYSLLSLRSFGKIVAGVGAEISYPSTAYRHRAGSAT